MADIESAYTETFKTWNEAFPPICLRSHWDPTAISRQILPVEQRSLPTDPRPAAMICKQYYTTSFAPQDGNIAPSGGAAGLGFPYESYNPNTESEVLRLNRPLSKCSEKRYMPHNGIPSSDMSMRDIPGADQRLNIAANIVTTSTYCRAEDDEAAWNRSSRLFFNTTRYDRTSDVPARGGQSPPLCDPGSKHKAALNGKSPIK